MKPSPLCRFLPALLSLAASPMVGAESMPPQVFEKSLTVLDDLNSISAAGDSAGGVIFSTRSTLARLSPLGAEKWVRTIPGSGGVITAGSSGDIYGAGTTVFKFSAEGELAWSKTPEGGGVLTKIVTDDQGGIYAAGATAGAKDLYLVKYDAGGNLQWTRQFGGSAGLDDLATGLVAVPGGGVVVTGLTRNPAESFVTIRYSASGTATWISYYDAPEKVESAPADIVRLSDGNFLVTGKSGSEAVAVKYTAGGAGEWARTLPEEVYQLAAGPSGDAVALTAGAQMTNPAWTPLGEAPQYVWPFYLVHIPADGGVSWSASLGNAEKRSTAQLIRMPGGGYLSSFGSAERNGSRDARLVSVNASGADMSESSLPQFLSLSFGPVVNRALTTSPDGGIWAIYHSESSTKLKVRRCGTTPPSAAPAAVTAGFDEVQPAGARLKGTVNPGGAQTTWHFEYGLTTAYGNATEDQTASGSLDVPTEVMKSVSGLDPATVYHFRLVAANSNGTSLGGDQTFHTTLSGWQQWVLDNFGSLDAPNTAASDDPDRDGLPNLVEYAFGTSGAAPDSGPGIPVFELWDSPTSGITFPSLVYRPDDAHTGITIVTEASNDLQTWTSAGIVTGNLPNGSRRAVAQGLQHFLRIRVTMQ